MSIIYIKPNDSIQTLLNNLNPNESHTIYLSEGIYREKLMIENNNLTFIGVSAYNTQIVFNDYSYKIHEDGLLFNTFRTSTLVITGNNNQFYNLKITNDAGHGPMIGQAISVSIYGINNYFDNCVIDGNQDTLFIGPLPEDLILRYQHILPLSMRKNNVYNNFFKHTTITGNIDFIFGSGNAFFKNCNLISNGSGYITAPSTYKDQIGFVFKNCVISSTSPEVDIILSRPWRENASTIFLDCSYKTFINPKRYDTWDKSIFYFYEYPYVDNNLSLPIPNSLKLKVFEVFENF